MKYDIMLANAMVLTPAGDILEGQNIAIKGNRIEKVTPDTLQPGSAEKQIDCRGKLVMPGMIDGHTHTSQQLLRGKLADEYPMIWTRFLVPFESTLTEEDVYYSALLYCIQAIRAGITGFAESGGRHMNMTANAVIQTGMRAAIARSMMDSGNSITGISSFPVFSVSGTASVLCSSVSAAPEASEAASVSPFGSQARASPALLSPGCPETRYSLCQRSR